MSMDWTPCMLYHADQTLKIHEGYSLRDMNIKFVYKGDEFPLINTSAKAQYPEFAFLFNRFGSLFEKYHEEPKAHEVFSTMEKALKAVEERFNQNENNVSESRKMYSMDEDTFLNEDINKVIEEWFYGRLDAHFYHNEVNDEMLNTFLEYQIERK